MSPERWWAIMSACILVTLGMPPLSCKGGNTNSDIASRKAFHADVGVTREMRIPANAIKVQEKDDAYRPVLRVDGWEQPVGLGPPINTAGGEDSPFITPDGNTLYFWFTPDVRVPPDKAILDGVTGIYVSSKGGNTWSDPTRIILQDAGQPALDGCPFVLGDVMYFCSARAGNYRGMDMWIAEWNEGKWRNWHNAGKRINADYQVGELHISADGKRMYFASDRPGGKGKRDIWVNENVKGEWQEPVNIKAVNSPYDDNLPFVTEDEKELWFTSDSRSLVGTPAIFRSTKNETGWSRPQEVISNFVGEPCLDRMGNVYFTHHFFKKGKHLEADIYVARKKPDQPQPPMN